MTNEEATQAQQSHIVIQHPETGTRRTISSILANKFLDGVEKSTFRQIFIEILEWAAILTTTALLIFPEWTAEAATTFWTFGNYAVPKFLACAILIKYRKDIKRIFRKLRYRGANEGMLCGIPKKEICHFLFEKGAFKLDEATKKFGLSRKNFDELAKALEAQKILIRGENNARVLNEAEFTRQEIYEMLLEAEKPKNIFKRWGFYAGGDRMHENARKEDISKELENVFQVRPLT